MFYNYLKIALRNLGAFKIYALINIGGLAIGFACVLLIAGYVYNELIFDTFHPNTKTTYRISSALEQDKQVATGFTSIEVGPFFKENLNEVTQFCRLMPFTGTQLVLKVPEKNMVVEKFYLADSTFHEFFGFEWLLGDPKKALSKPLNIILSKDVAINLFNEIDQALGKNVLFRNQSYTVTGVLQNPPQNTEYPYDAIISFSTIPADVYKVYADDWFRISAQTFIRTTQPITQDQFSQFTAALFQNKINAFISENGLQGTLSFSYSPIAKTHFDNTKEYDNPKGNLWTVIAFSAIALIILLVACINYINLSLAKFATRAKEIAVRKTLGASKNQIFFQFFTESFLIAFLAVILALAIVEITLPAFNEITNKQFWFGWFFHPNILIITFFILVFTGLFAGGYPAYIQSKFKPVTIFRGNRDKLFNIGLIKKMLVLIQFVFSISLIISTLVVYSQFKFLQNAPLGFDSDQVIVASIPSDSLIVSKVNYLKQQFSKLNQVEQVSVSGNLPDGNLGRLIFRVEKPKIGLTQMAVKYMVVDNEFVETLGIPYLAGSNFSNQNPEKQFIINRAAAEMMGWNQQAIGKNIQWGLLSNNEAAYSGRVVGVVQNFNFESLHEAIEPLIIITKPEIYRYFNIRVQSISPEVIASLQNIWHSEFPDTYIEFMPLNHHLKMLYNSEAKTLSILKYFAAISIFLSVIGLFALTSFMVEQRLKELSIRKVLGANFSSHLLLLGKEFMLLIGLSFCIAAPISYYVLQNWLNEFAYSQQIQFGYFGLSLLLAFLLSSVAIFYHIKKIGRFNPINALKT